MIHMSLEAKLSSLYAPEFHFQGTLTGDPKDIKIKIEGSMGENEMCIVQAQGCIPNRSDQTLSISKPSEFSFVLAWRDRDYNPAPFFGIDGIKSIFAGFYPFDSQLFWIRFSGENCVLTSSLRIEIPPYLTRYTRDTKNLQHVFSERGLRPPSFMAGLAEQGEEFALHLHYKSLDAFRRISLPALTMLWVFLLDLIAMELAPENQDWTEAPTTLFAFLSINAAAFSALAAIRVGSTLRSLLNFVRLMGVLWVLLLTATIRIKSLPFFGTDIGQLIDIGLKAAIVWIVITGLFAFGPYAMVPDIRKRSKIFIYFLIAGVMTCILVSVYTSWLGPVITFQELLRQ